MLAAGVAALFLQAPRREAPPPVAGLGSPSAPDGRLREAEALLLRHLEGETVDLDRLEGLLRPLVEKPEGLRLPFLPRFYLTWMGEELGRGDLRLADLNPGRRVIYGFLFHHPDRSAAEFLRGKLAQPTDYTLPELYVQVGGGGFDSKRDDENGPFLDLLEPLEGKTVVDLGGGLGYLAWEAARRVGPDGRVTILELDPSLAEFVAYTGRLEPYRTWAPRLRFAEVRSPTDPGVTGADVLTMQDVHALCDPEYERFGRALLPRLRDAVVPGGVVAVMETFREDVDPPRARARLEAAGLRVVKSVPLRDGEGFMMVARREP